MTQGEREVDIPIKRFNQFPESAILPQGALADYARQFATGNHISWEEIHNVGEFLDTKPDKFLLRKFHNSLLNMPTEQSEIAIKILADDLESFVPNINLILSDKFAQFWGKLDFGLHMAVDYDGLDEAERSTEERRYQQIADTQYTNLALVFSEFNLQDLPALWRVESFMQSYSIFVKNWHDDSQLRPEEHSKSSQMNQEFLEAFQTARERLYNEDWGWEQIKQAIEVLALSESRFMTASIANGLLVQIGRSKRLSQESLEQVDPQHLNFNPEGLVKLLDFKIREREFVLFEAGTPWEDFYNGDLSDLIKVPNKYLPVELIRLYHLAAKRIPTDFLNSQLVYLKRQADTKKDSTANFVSLVVSLCSHGVITGEEVESLLVGLKNLPGNFKEILTNQKPGRIFLTPERKLRAKGPNDSLNSAFLLYQSEAQEVIEQQQIQTTAVQVSIKPEQTIDESNKTPESILEYDFIGDLAIAKDSDVRNFLEEQSRKNTLFEDQLLEKLDILQKEYQPPANDQTLIFHSDLNSEDSAMREARRFGIETVVISGPVVTFVINHDQIYAKYEDGKIPLAFTAVLNESGWLEFDVDEENPVPDEIQLVFTSIVLGLLSYQKEIPQKANGEAINGLKERIANWNRIKRGNFGRLSWDPQSESEVFVAIKTNSQTIFLPYT